MVGVREDESDAPLHLATVRGDVDAVHRDRARARGGEPVEQSGEGCLAGPIGADDRGAGAIDGERHLAQKLDTVLGAYAYIGARDHAMLP